MIKYYLSAFLFISSCQTTPSGPDPMILEGLKKIEEKQNELDASIAKLDAKLQNIDIYVKDQQAKLDLLERGLTLGVIPKELAQKEEVTSPTSEIKKIISIVPSQTKQNDLSNYQSKLLLAKEAFNKNKFDDAYKIFSELESEFSRQITEGDPTFWRGRSWLALGEYEAAKKCFENFLNGDPLSVTTKPSALFYLAKTELGMNMREIAVKHLQEVIQGFPEDSSAQASRQLLLDLKNNI